MSRVRGLRRRPSAEKQLEDFVGDGVQVPEGHDILVHREGGVGR